MPIDTQSLPTLEKTVPYIGALITGVGGMFVKGFFDTWKESRKETRSDQKTVIDANASLREYVKGLFEEERRQHLAEKQALLAEIKNLKDRISELETRREGDEEARRQMAQREAELIVQVGTLNAHRIESEAIIKSQNMQIEALKAEIDQLKAHMNSVQKDGAN